MRNILLTLTYDGSKYHGWQIQNNAVTVQEVFQNALFRVIGTPTDIKGCSRTDSGVHANMYCVSFHTEHRIPLERLPAAVNNYLPDSIAVLDAAEADDDFHARYSCKGKEYIYKIWNAEIRNPFLVSYALHYWYQLDIDKMNRAAEHFLGTHDFTSFCTLDNREKGDFHRTISHLSVSKENDMVTITVQADGFLYNMVRIIVGTLLYVSQGKIAPDEIPSIIRAENRQLAGPTAPPEGLYLNKVIY
ncbi:MAG: tRNA pseudouridine(38-40) synthase TruA [Clostridia bacterium]|nr:tRNA pseudouridine(38-40) synthase TruA [Clostridia bacterium]MBR2177183.1 tRNA pseudouridine(38-40) synthase TruA [Clostridia bacterium]